MNPRSELAVHRACPSRAWGSGRQGCCAGCAGCAEMDLATWAQTIAVDLTGVFLCCRAVLPGMIERGSGRIINIASQLGIKGGEGLAHYAAAKAGVVGLTKSLALDGSTVICTSVDGKKQLLRRGALSDPGGWPALEACINATDSPRCARM
ncbi:SDR family NAD(P)-dependent oxidoreductase [Streptomyces tubercidicus]|uniref:SDR family NAD(P)-dependent oxidoreductase n=1 Tax=Streptomyces tubercidicus TaxID=47759 RepID=UPI0034678D80